MGNANPIVIGHWAARIVAGGILVMGAMPKFTGGAGALAEKLPGGNTAVLAIGAAEVIAIALMFIPKTTIVGSALAALIMLGAVGSHVAGPVGMEGDAGGMFPMAIAALLAAGAATFLAWKRGLLPGRPTAQPT